ncbi:hypothetical protein AMTRI_Chr12g268980 [Amborella trichopoda]
MFSLGKGRAAFVLRSDQDVAQAWKERFYKVRDPLMTLLEWSPSTRSSFVKRDLTWFCLWGVLLHVWNESVFKEIVNSFGEYRVVDLKLLGGSNASFVRVQISHFLGVPCSRHIRLQVGHDLFLIDVCLESNCTTTNNFHKSDQMAQPCEMQSPKEEWTKVRERTVKQVLETFHRKIWNMVGGFVGLVKFNRKHLNWARKNLECQNQVVKWHMVTRELKVRKRWIPVRHFLDSYKLPSSWVGLTSVNALKVVTL